MQPHMSDGAGRLRPDESGAPEFRALLHAAADGIVVIDQQGRIIEFNPAAERLLGRSAAEVIGRSVEILMPEPHRSRHAQYLERYLTRGEARIIGLGREVEAQRANGDTLPIALSVGEAADQAGGRRFIGIIRDLSAQKNAERETRDLQQRLAHVSRYSLMSEMAAGIAHEINQPLSAITTYAQAGKRVAAADSGNPKALMDICDKIAEQATRAGKVIQNLRNFIRKQEGCKEILDLNQVIRSGLNLVESNARAEGVELVVECAEESLHVEGDVVQLQQVLFNLARNGIDALRLASSHKLLTIKTEAVSEDTARVSVSDTGHGIPEELERDLFHPFVTRKEDGLGVGLAISKTIIQAHGGQLVYQPNPLGGAVFAFRLPRHREH